MRRYGVLIVAAGLSCSIHLAVAAGWPNKDVVVVGGDVAGEVALGNSFADLVAGTLQSTVQDVEIKPTSTTALVKPVRPTSQTASMVGSTAQPVSPDTTTTPASPLAIVTLNTSAGTISPSDAREPVTLTSSVRPVARPTPKSPAQTTAHAPRGNAQVNAATGQAAGRQNGLVAQSSAAQQTTARQVGQGEIDTYKLRVASRVIRVAERMRSRGTHGTVVVGMQISSNGTLAGATVAQSSGHATADAIALDAIRRAAPFDPTPTGQSMSVAFRVQLVSR